MIGNPITGIVKADDAVGVVRNVPPTAHQQTTTVGGDTEVYNSGSDSLQFEARIIDRNREDDIGNVGDVLDEGGGVPASRYSWLNISRAGGNYTNYTCIVHQSPGANQVELFNYTGGGYTATDGILCLSNNHANTYFEWTCPATWETGTYYANLSIADTAGNRCNFDAFSFTVKSAIKTIGVYNYTGLAVDIATPFHWNFTTTDPGVLNVTSGNWSYTGTAEPANNYGYDNDTGRQWSYWIIVNNSGGAVSQCFNVSFGATGFTSATNSGTDITTGNVIRFEYYRTGNLTYEGASTAGTNSNASWVTANEPSNLTYVEDGDGGDQAANDGMYMFQFDEASQNIWIRFMIDIPAVCKASTDYTCAYSVTA